MSKKIDIDKNWLREEYIVKRRTVTDIAKEISCSRATISKKLKLYELVRTTEKYLLNTGDKFGRLTVVEEVYKKDGTRYFCCKCTCGKFCEISKSAIFTGATKSCGCITREKGEKCGEISGGYWQHVKKSAKARNIKFNLEVKTAWDIFLKQNRKCALSGVELVFAPKMKLTTQTASLDRINSDEHYEAKNVRWVHKDLNRIRNVYSDEVFLEWCRKCFLYSYQKDFCRPSFHDYFLMLAFDVSLRSEDEFIKHGAVIVDNKSKHIIGTGYNATLREFDKTYIDMKNRDERRPWMLHAEDNAIMNCVLNPLNLVNGASIYVTGLPCIPCLQKIINFGIKEIYYVDREGSITENESTQKMREKILSIPNLIIQKIPVNNLWIKKVYYSEN